MARHSLGRMDPPPPGALTMVPQPRQTRPPRQDCPGQLAKCGCRTRQLRRVAMCENFLYGFKGARSAPCGLAPGHAKRRAMSASSRAWRNDRPQLAEPWRTPTRSRSPGLPLLGPAGPRRRPARVGTRGVRPRRTQHRRSKACARCYMKGPSLRCPDPEALQVRRPAQL